MGLGPCVSLLEESHTLGYDRVQQAQTKVAHLAKVAGRRGCKTFSLAFHVSFCVQASRVFKYDICLFLIPAVFPKCTMVSVERGVAGETSCNNLIHSLLVTLWWPLCFPVFVPLCLARVCSMVL